MTTHKEHSTTRTALEESIAHWKQLTANPLTWPIGMGSCALCTMFRADDIDIECADCPVMIRSGANFCHYTPYTDFFNYRAEVKAKLAAEDLRLSERSQVDHKRLVTLAKKEVSFLKSLRKDTP